MTQMITTPKSKELGTGRLCCHVSGRLAPRILADSLHKLLSRLFYQGSWRHAPDVDLPDECANTARHP